MGKSCNIFCRVRDKSTGKLTDKVSVLHKDLLGLKKINSSFGRRKANRAFYLSENEDFLKANEDKIVFDANQEPKIASLYECAREAFPNISLKDMRDFLSNRYKAGEYSFTEAYSLMQQFNREANGARTFMASLKPGNNGKYNFSIEYTTKGNIQQLHSTLSQHVFEQKIMDILEKNGIGIDKGTTSQYNTINPKILSNGLLGLIQLKEGASFKELSQEIGHLIVGGMGNHPLVQRLTKLVEENKEAILSQLGSEDRMLYGNAKSIKVTRELMGHLVGKYLREYGEKPSGLKGILKSFGNLVSKCIDWIKAHMSLNNRDYYKALYESKQLARTMVKEFMHENIQNMVSNALSNEELLHTSAADALFQAVKKHVQNVYKTLEENKENLTRKQYKSAKKSFGSIMEAFNSVNQERRKALESGGDIFNADLELQSLVLINNILGNYVKELDSIRNVLLSLSVLSDPDTGEPYSINERCKLLLHAERTLSSLKTLIEDLETIKSLINNDSYKEGLESLIDSANNILEFTTNTGERTTIGELVRKNREALAVDLLVEINGSHYYMLDQCIKSQGFLRVTRRKKELIDFRNLIKSTDVNPTFNKLSEYIQGMAESADLINQMVYVYTEAKKLEANKKTTECMGKLFQLNDEFKEVGITDTRVLYETDSNNKLTGNLISEYHWGNYEKAKKEAIKSFREKYFEANADMYNNNMFNMDNDGRYLAALAGYMRVFRDAHMKKIPKLDKQGKPILDKQGKPVKVWVPNVNTHPEYKGQLDKLNPAQLDVFNKYLEIKSELDSYLPDGATHVSRAPQFANSYVSIAKNYINSKSKVEDVKTAFKEWSKRLINSTKINDIEFGDDTDTYDFDENSLIDEAFFNDLNSIDRIPKYGIKKLTDSNLLSTDLIQSTIAYAQMAHNYNAFNEIIDSVENLKNQMKSRTIGNTKETVESQLLRTGKAPATYMRLQDYIKLNLYQNYLPKPINNKNRLKRLLRATFSNASRFGSLWFLGGKVAPSILNANTMLINLLQESFGGKYTLKDFTKAEGLYIGYFMQSLIFRAATYLNTQNLLPRSHGSRISSTDKMSAFKRLFNIGEKNNIDFKNQSTNEYMGRLGKIIPSLSDVLMLLYSVPNDWGEIMPYLIEAQALKLIDKNTGNEVSLWDAYIVGEDGELHLDSTKDWYIDSENNKRLIEYSKNLSNQEEATIFNEVKDKELVPFDSIQESIFSRRCATASNRLNGTYSTADQAKYAGNIYSVLFTTLKKYAFGYIEWLFGSSKDDYLNSTRREGLFVTSYLALLDSICNSKSVTSDYMGKEVLKYPGSVIEGALTFFYILSVSSTSTIVPMKGFKNYVDEMLKERGYSEGQVKSMKTLVAKYASIAFLEILSKYLLSISIGSDDDDKDEDEVEEIESFEDIDARYSDVELWFSNSINSVDIHTKRFLSNLGYKFTDNDEELLYNEDYIKRNKYIIKDGKTPRRAWALRDIGFLFAARALVEQKAYTPTYFKDMFKEYQSLFTTSIPALTASFQAAEVVSTELGDPYGEDLKKKYGENILEGMNNKIDREDLSEEEINEILADYKYFTDLKYDRGSYKDLYKHSVTMYKLLPFFGNGTVSMKDAIETTNNYMVYRSGSIDRNFNKFDPDNPDNSDKN